MTATTRLEKERLVCASGNNGVCVYSHRTANHSNEITWIWFSQTETSPSEKLWNHFSFFSGQYLETNSANEVITNKSKDENEKYAGGW